MSICVPLVHKNPDGESYLFSSVLAYTIEFGMQKEIESFLDKYQNIEMTKDECMDFARGFSKIGKYDKALTFLSKDNLCSTILDSLRFATIRTQILKKQGKYEDALHSYKDYSIMLERHLNRLLSQGVLFADKRHQLEMENLMEVQKRDNIIWATACGVFALLLLVAWLYYRGHLNKTKRIAEQRQHELETANLKLEIAQLEGERDSLKELQRELSELANPIQDVIKNRLDLLNGLLAKEITSNKSYAEPYNKWIETIHNDKKKFMDSTRLAFTASHPKFMEYLEQHGLSIDEINYLCLYAIGLRGKEVGEYIQLKRHYIISHEIRKKLDIGEHETNIGLYIRRQMKHFE